MSGLAYVLRNDSKAPELADAALSMMVADSQQAYDEDFAPMHGLLPITITVLASGIAFPAGVRNVRIVENDASVPDAVAYHTVDAQGNPELVVSVDAARSEGGSILDQISIALTHEIFETSRNPFVAFCAMAPGKAVPQMLEVCDPVQGGSYKKNETAISNFVTPAYFDANDSKGPYDKCGQLTAPFQCDAEGYIPWADGTQTFGEELSDTKKLHASSHGRAAKGIVSYEAIVPATLDATENDEHRALVQEMNDEINQRGDKIEKLEDELSALRARPAKVVSVFEKEAPRVFPVSDGEAHAAESIALGGQTAVTEKIRPTLRAIAAKEAIVISEDVKEAAAALFFDWTQRECASPSALSLLQKIGAS
jgi:hypothetical protein